MMTSDDVSREGTYGMLAELFSRPPRDEEVAALFGEGSGLDTDELAADFTDLLMGLRSTSPAPPYESFHREGVLMGETTTQVLEAYRTFGVGCTEGMEGEPADHISLELDFMRHLCSLEASAEDPEEATRLLEAQEGFLSVHLSRWVDGVRDGISAVDRTGFYTRVASFTSDWVASDLEHVRERLGSQGVVG